MKKKIKILYIINSLQIGGAEKNLVSLCNYLSKNQNNINYEIHILSIDDISSYYKKYLKNIKIYELNYKQNNSFLVFFKIYNLINKIDPDLIHSWLYGSDLIATIISILQKRKNIVWSIRSSNTMRHLNFFSRMFVRILSIFSGMIPKKIIANSHNGKKDHINLGYEKSKIEVIHNGYNLNFFDEESSIPNSAYSDESQKQKLQNGFAQFVPICTSKESTNYEYTVSVNDKTIGFDVYFVPSPVQQWYYFLFPENFEHYSNDGCFANNFQKFSGECSSVDKNSGLLIVVPDELSRPMTKISVNLVET